ncbi:O-succinylhomoserine sulfhydrylase [Paraburkholderia tropica]|uniref:O-succinylhomoserine sulfhydrylase n=2 Tax=Burkholderiales TaxID=80840 RepID=A0A1A5XFB8_9BURK|nr:MULTISPECIES: O-succinylhomoserine sulfhydrylase [Paraburkholderia]MBB2978788.1 O-succinylhomoserine sulfhydrylase [Paraburkholderia tropica]MBB2999382.1 O-succinylhomoserine sulfhydrylase [Paraburkholderia tropica]MBB6318718.1 O-succinylhomoserine sulfhydrylase [Paraburkholderia tropica]MDE1139102.1 O-succinylhomoserine sulfhydrylase [Paraburkholderia tropica]OBR51808.1 O-succinylhomoserine sulfhydrylase [Paraburkholderia tropica]
MDDNLNFDTLAVRSGTLRSEFNEHSEALYLTSSFCFGSAAEAAERFKNSETGYTYARFTNPTVTMFQDRLAALEGGEACMATASGMAAIMSVVMSALQQGDHIVSSQSIFGSTLGMFSQIFSKFGITTTFVDPTDLDAWKNAVRPETKMFFLETPSNPLTEVADITAVSKIAKEAGALFVVDNCFCSPALQQPLKLGADVVMHSATKFLDGQGRVLGGALVGSKQFIMEKVFPFVRSAGPTLSAFNAWVLLKGMETLSLRVEKQSANALEIARWLEAHPSVKRVYYPGLASHPQHELAMRQQKAGGAIVSFEVKGDTPEEQRANAWRVIDNTRVCSITGNLGDTRTTITHPATTTHGRISPEARAAAGITEGLIRLAVGLEDPQDVRGDLARGLGQ